MISQLKPLTAEDKQYRMIMDEKRKAMEPLQDALGKLRSANITAREKGIGLCASEEELNDLVSNSYCIIDSNLCFILCVSDGFFFVK